MSAAYASNDVVSAMVPEPDGAPRLLPLDVLRGVAILAILFMNMDGMGAAMEGFFLGDPRLLGWTELDRIVWWTRQLFAEGTARCLLELLFGAGMVILTDRAAATLPGGRVLRDYAWRNVVLLLFGLAHVFLLLWPGDILHTYALAALATMGLRRLRPRLLLTLGLALATLQLVGGVADALVADRQRAAVDAAGTHAVPTAAERSLIAADDRDRAARARDRADALARIAAEDRARSGSAVGWVRSLWGSFLHMQSLWLEPFFVGEAASVMLVGAALFRWGVLQGGRSAWFYLGLTVAGYGLGLPLRAWAAYALTRFHDAPSLAPAFGEWARILVALGHLGLVMLLLRTGLGARALRPFAAAGRTALTIYIAQTLTCLWVLYPPWGFAFYGRQGWVGLMTTALLVDAGLLAAAVWWTRRSAIGPVEWAWRSIVAGRRLPMRLPRAP